MRNRWIDWGFALVLGVFNFGCVGSDAEDFVLAEDTGKAALGLVVCSKDNVPPGSVVTAIRSGGSCTPRYSYTAVEPYDGVVMCRVTPIPSGWVPVTMSSPAACSTGTLGGHSYFGNALRLPYSGVVMCSVPDATVPVGWVVTDIVSTSMCSAGGIGNPSYWGRKLAEPTTGIVVCSSSPTPSGWVRTTRVSTGRCNGEWGWVLRPG